MRRIKIYVDWEKIGWVYCGDGDMFTMSPADFAAGKLFELHPGARVYIENAHLGPRSERNTSKPLSEMELHVLVLLAERYGCEIFQIPARLATRARKECLSPAGKSYTKAQDTIMYRQFFAANPQIHLTYFQPPSSYALARMVEERKISKAGSEMLERMAIQGYSDPVSLRARAAFTTVQDKLQPETRAFFFDKGGKFRNAQFMALYVMLFDDDGRLRRREGNQLIGIGAIKRAFGLTPYSHGSAPRAKLMVFGRQNLLRRADISEYPQLRNFHNRLCNATLRALRDYGLANNL